MMGSVGGPGGYPFFLRPVPERCSSTTPIIVAPRTTAVKYLSAKGVSILVYGLYASGSC